jgi:hypothetical protein
MWASVGAALRQTGNGSIPKNAAKSSADFQSAPGEQLPSPEADWKSALLISPQKKLSFTSVSAPHPVHNPVADRFVQLTQRLGTHRVLTAHEVILP